MPSPPSHDRPELRADGAGTVTVRASDPRLRLQRTLPGERLHQVPELADRTAARGEWQERPSPVPTRERTVRDGKVKVASRRVDPGPYAPQLIRLVQHPFVLDTVRSRPDPERGRPARIKVAEQGRDPFGQALRLALVEGHRLPFPSPTDLRPSPLRPARLPLSAWLGQRGPDERAEDER